MGQDIRIGMSLEAANMGNFKTANDQGPPFDKAVGIISKTYTEHEFYRLTAQYGAQWQLLQLPLEQLLQPDEPEDDE
jgi:hypothetical protein